MRPGLKSLVLALGVLVLAACVALPKAPTLSWTGVNLDIIGFREQRFTLKLKVANPNDVDLPLERLEFDIELAGQHFAHALSDRPMTVPARGEATLAVQASGNVIEFIHRLGPLRGDSASLDYRLKGDAVVTGYGRIPFDKKGKVSLLQMLRDDRQGDSKALPGAI